MLGAMQVDKILHLARAGGIYPGTLPLDRVEVLVARESVAALEICRRRRKHRCDAQKVAATAVEHLVLPESKL
nr:hypothetical protein [Tanacetum cinerariifolium]